MTRNQCKKPKTEKSMKISQINNFVSLRTIAATKGFSRGKAKASEEAQTLKCLSTLFKIVQISKNPSTIL
jgi:hypothetical protein